MSSSDSRRSIALQRAYEYLELEKRGMSQSQIADMYHVDQTSVSQFVRKVRPSKFQRLPESKLQDLTQRWGAGVPIKMIAEEVGIPFGSIPKLVKRLGLPARRTQ